MQQYKDLIICLAGVLAIASVCSGRPNQNEKLIKAATAFAQDTPSKLPQADEDTSKKVDMPIHVYYDEAATVREVDEDHFRQGKQLLPSSFNQNGIRRRIERYEKVYKPYETDGTVWSSLTNVVEYGDDRRYKRDASRMINDEVFLNSRTIPLKKLKRDNAHILRIKVGRGGVAIAGPGGVASAGTGGTAIVGPGGSAYTEADGTAVVGPGAKLYQIPEGKRGRSSFKEYKLIATGPFVFQPTPKSTEPLAFF